MSIVYWVSISLKDFFISYNKADRAWAEWIAWQLEEAHYTTKLQAWDFRPGSNFVLEMQRASSEAARTIAVLSPAYVAALFTQPEWAAAFAQDPTGEQGTLLPIRVQECELTGILRPIIYIDLVGLDQARAAHELLNGVQRGRAKPMSAPAFPGTATHSIPKAVRFPGALPPIWNVPHHRNLNLTGRDAVLDDLHAQGASGSIGPSIQVICGLGGLGKTQLTVEYAYRYASDFDIVWWVRSEQPETLATDYAGLAPLLGLSETDVTDQQAIVEAVRRWLDQHERWLLVFDNAPELAAVQGYLPQGSDGQTLITSRNQIWAGKARRVPLIPLSRDDSIQFLLTRTGRIGHTEAAIAATLAEELGGLPLALEQAAAYIDETSTSFADYLDLFRSRRQALWGHEKPPVDYPDTVRTTWSLAMERVREASPAAVDLLRLFAFLAPDAIQRDVIAAGAPHLPVTLAATVADALLFNAAIGALRRYSLIETHDTAIAVHRLVQAVVRDALRPDEQKVWAGAAVRLINAAFPVDSGAVRAWPVCRLLLTHALTSASRADRLQTDAVATYWLFDRLGLFLKARAQFANATQAHQRALDLAQAAAGPNHPDVAAILSHLGMVFYELGDFTTAVGLNERALTILEAAYGQRHPDVAAAHNNLGSALLKARRLSDARYHLVQALSIDQTIRRENDPVLATRLGNVGSLLLEEDKPADAVPYFEQAVAIDERVYGLDHPELATDLNSLAMALDHLGDLARARELYERALLIDEAAFGPDHPKVAIRLSNLGETLRQLGQLKEARACCERALAIDQAAYGPTHYLVDTRLNNLGLVLLDLGESERARTLFEKALAIAEAASGPQHPAVVRDLSNLACAARSLGEQEEALRLYDRALQIARAALGQNHSLTVAIQSNIASISGDT